MALTYQLHGPWRVETRRLQTEEAEMLSEIFFLKLEAALRATEETSRIGNTRFIPQAPGMVPKMPESSSRDFGTGLDDHFTERVETFIAPDQIN